MPAQGTQLFSPNGKVYLVIESSGNMCAYVSSQSRLPHSNEVVMIEAHHVCARSVLYHTALQAQYGPVPAAAIWSANSSAGNGPFKLTMQKVQTAFPPPGGETAAILPVSPLTPMQGLTRFSCTSTELQPRC